MTENAFIPLIAKMHLFKVQEVECDSDAYETWHLPSVAADHADMDTLSEIEFAFSNYFLEFLRAANG